jgi:hypothetical protein
MVTNRCMAQSACEVYEHGNLTNTTHVCHELHKRAEPRPPRRSRSFGPWSPDDPERYKLELDRKVQDILKESPLKRRHQDVNERVLELERLVRETAELSRHVEKLGETKRTLDERMLEML